VYPALTEEPIRNGRIVLRNSKIAAVGSRASVAIPPNAQSLDCSGLTITAGFWNIHVHLFGRKWADAASISATDLIRQLRDMLQIDIMY